MKNKVQKKKVKSKKNTVIRDFINGHLIGCDIIVPKLKKKFDLKKSQICSKAYIFQKKKISVRFLLDQIGIFNINDVGVLYNFLI